jgi:sulfur-carrier protein
MSIAIHIPSGLREYCHCPAEINLTAATVGAALEELQREYSSLYTCVCDETGSVRRHVNLFVNSDMVPVRHDSGLATPLRAGDVLTIWQAVSGG